MKIVVCVKQVPDTWSEKKLDPATKTLDRASVDGVMNELDEYAVEEALKIAEATSGEVVVLSMGPEQSTETIRKALSMGADAGIHILDDGLAGSDAVATSLAIAKVLEGRGADLVIFGSESTDARMSVIPAMVAERLGLPQLTFANKVEAPGDGTIKAHRLTDYGYDVVEASYSGSGLRRREDQRAEVPVLQGHHGREEEAGRDHRVGRRRYRSRLGGPRRRVERGRRVRCGPRPRRGDHRHRRG
jgi:electron transfer flavoprotein beta subunit